MNVCHVVPALDPSLGGPPVVAARLAAAQAALGHDVSILYYDTPDKRADIDAAMRAIPGASRVKLIPLTPPAGRLASVFASTKPVENVIRLASILHLHGVWESLIRNAATAARRLHIPYVLAPHGMLDPWSLRQKALKKKIALALGYRAMLNKAAFLHLLNRDEAALLGPLSLKCPVRIIPNGIFLSEIEEPSAGTTPDVGDRPYILFLSRLHYKKGLDFLADAFARVHEKAPDWQLVVAGPDGGAREEFVARVKQLGLENSVCLVGPVYGAAKFELLRRAGCFCLPSRQEGFSVAILEALACRIPVVISENCHFPEVSEAGAGLIVPLEPLTIGDAILELATDPDRRRHMGQTGRRLVEERFTWDRVAAQSIAEYERTI
jgi:glycosyltransferase involved in cell wall biosynthesis